ncbi:unnamed protein product, partial [Rotaria sordida]
MLMLYKHNNTKLINEHHETVVKILKNFSSDKLNCNECIRNHTSYDQIEIILESYEDIVDQHTILKYVRSVLNIFGLFNISIVLIVYGSPIIINTTTVINAICLIVVQYIETVNTLAYLESIIALVATIATVQSSYILIIAMFERPQPLDYLLNRNKWIILLICLILIITYYWILSIVFSMMKNIHSKHEYFDEHLKKERDELNTITQKLFQLKKVARDNLDINDK